MTTSFTSRTGTFPEEGIKAPCVVSTLLDTTLSGEQTIDLVSVVAGDRVLVRGQSDNTENGIYIVKVGAWERSKDWNQGKDVGPGMLVTDYSNKDVWGAVFTGDYSPGITELTFDLYFRASEFDDSPRPLDTLKSDTSIIVGDSRLSSEYVTGLGIGFGLYGKVSVNPGDNLINPATTDGNWLKLLHSGVVSVDQAGAVGGVTDDAAAFQAVADFLDTGMTMTGSLPSYLIGSNIVITSKTDVIIDFAGSDIVADETSVTTMFEVTNSEDVTIRNCRFNGNIDKDNDNRPTLVTLTDSPRFNLLNNYILNVQYGVIAAGTLSNDAVIKNNSFIGTTAYAGGTNNRQLAGVLAYGFATANGWLVSGNLVRLANHLTLGGGTFNWIVTDNHCYDTIDSSIYLFNSGHHISNNSVFNAGKDGIKILDNITPGANLNNTISNNFVIGAGLVKDDSGICIIIEGANSKVIGNTCVVTDISLGATPAATAIISNGLNALIADNNVSSFSNTQTGGGITIISDTSSDGTIVSDNIIKNFKQGVTLGQETTNTMNSIVVKDNQFLQCPTGVLPTSVDKTLFNDLVVEGNNFNGSDTAIATFSSSDGIVSPVYRNNNTTNTSGFAFRVEGDLDNLLFIGNRTDGTESSYFTGPSSLFTQIDNFVLDLPRPNNIIGSEQTITIADDGVYSFTPLAITAYTIEIIQQIAISYGKAVTEISGGDTTIKIFGSANFDVSNSVLTGTTGVDGNVTYSANSNVAYIENRTGASWSFSYKLFGNV